METGATFQIPDERRRPYRRPIGGEVTEATSADRVASPPLDVGAAVDRILIRRGWSAPCPELFELLAAEHPVLLLHLLEDGYLNRVALSQAAEAAGRLENESLALKALTPLLEHPEPIVRIGALGGVGALSAPGAALRAIRQMAEGDENEAVRVAARDALLLLE